MSLLMAFYALGSIESVEDLVFRLLEVPLEANQASFILNKVYFSRFGDTKPLFIGLSSLYTFMHIHS